MPEHGVGFLELFGTLANGRHVSAEAVRDLLHLLVGVRQEFVQRRVKQADSSPAGRP